MIYIDTLSTDPAYNFAVEEYFMSTKPQEDTVFLFWRTEPTVMLGKFQNSYKELNLPAIQADGINVVRRQTGGGTIYTDLGGWQFSFIMPEKFEEINFGQFMNPIIDALAQLGIQAEYNSRNDLTVDGLKFSGNAQATRGNFTLHHGSLLYDTDFSKMTRYINPPLHKLQARGIDSIRSRTINLIEKAPERWSSQEFAEKMIDAILANGANHHSLGEMDKAAITRITDDKFRSWDWTYGKNPAFTLTHSRVTKGGLIEVALEVEKGHITACTIHGDFFSAQGIDSFIAAIIGHPYKREEVAKVLVQYPGLIHLVSDEEILASFFGD